MTGTTCKMPGCPWPEAKFGLCLQHLFEMGRAKHCAQCRHLFICPDGHYHRQKYCGRVCVHRMLARRRRRVPLDPAALVRLYVEQGKSLEEMAREFGASESNVQRALAKLEIPRRLRGWKRAAHCPELGCPRPPFRSGNPQYHTGRTCRFHFLLRHARQNHLWRLRSRHTREIRRG